jgi:hypothetical protein
MQTESATRREEVAASEPSLAAAAAPVAETVALDAPAENAPDGVANERDAPAPGMILRMASRFGQSLPGRALRRLTPRRMRAALKARLR